MTDSKYERNGKVLDMAVMQAYAAAKEFSLKPDADTQSTPSWKSFRFNTAGTAAVAVSSNNIMHTFDMIKGKPTKTIPSQKYGVEIAAYLNFEHEDSLLHSSADNTDHAIRLYSLKAKRYTRYFSGHTGLVTSLELNPKNERFVTASRDGTVRIWDLRSTNCQAFLKLDTGSKPLAAFDPSGKCLFVVLNQANVIIAYDQTKVQTGPFMTRQLNDPSWTADYDSQILCMSFATSSPMLLVATSRHAYILDTRNGHVLFCLDHRDSEVDPSIMQSETSVKVPPLKPTDSYMTAELKISNQSEKTAFKKPANWTWSPSSKYVLSPSSNSSHILCWNIPSPASHSLHSENLAAEPPISRLRPCLALSASQNQAIEGIQWHTLTPMFSCWAKDKLQFWISEHEDLDDQMQDMVF